MNYYNYALFLKDVTVRALFTCVHRSFIIPVNESVYLYSNILVYIVQTVLNIKGIKPYILISK